MQILSDQEWKDILKDQEESKLTIAEYCRLHNLKEPTFYRKRRKLFNQDTVSFLPVIVGDMENKDLSIVINGVPICFNSSVDDDSLKRIIRLCNSL